MKLHDLAVTAQTKQVAKVMESYFGQEVNFSKLTRPQARNMLNRVRGLITEHRRQPSFHQSEQNPAYLKLVMMEQGLAGKLREQDAVPAGQPNPQNVAMQMAQRKKQLQDQLKQAQEQVRMIQNQINQPSLGMAEDQHSLRRRLKEASEVQQAQVVLASKDMVDQVQKMIETATSIQFKDLPALVDQIRNEIGYEQATQFNSDATTALSGLVQNLQASKGQLEGALGVVTGQAPQVPGQELAAPAADLGAELPPAGEEELDLDVDVEEPEEEPSSLETTLGRGKR
jgi:hypothetical protein